jgi:hypothetical protein
LSDVADKYDAGGRLTKAFLKWVKAASCEDGVIRHKKVKLTLTTHVAGGLTENDFILAAQCNKAFAKCLEP